MDHGEGTTSNYNLPMKWIIATLLTLAIVAEAAPPAKEKPAPFTVVEASIPEMQAALKSGRITSHELVQQYLVRPAPYEDRLNAAITVNPNALKDADEPDAARVA